MENDPLIGKPLGAYLIQSRIGEGGMARVYKAYHARLRREVAIKVILTEIADQENFQSRFEREAQLIASLDHPNIVAVYDFGESENLTYLVMQYVGGGTLRDLLRGQRALDPREAARYALQMAYALHHAHLRGIVHRDVKPQNMLLSATDRSHLLLSDFGIAKLFDTSREVTVTPLSPGSIRSQELTSAGQIVGTAEYMSPEQANLKPVDARTDVYSLGVVLFQMLTGQVPFHSASVLGLLYQHINTVPLSVRDLNPAVPELLARITAKALAKAPEGRFQSAAEMAHALETALTSSPVDLSSSQEDYRTIPGTASQLPAHTAPGPATAPPPPGFGPPSYTNVTSASGPSLRSTPASGITHTGAITARPRSKFPLSYTMAAIVIALLIVFGILRTVLPGITGGPGNTPQTAGPATPFTENFQDNKRGWIATSMNGLTASTPSNGSYVLTTDSSVTNTTYLFPHPDPVAVGALPANFTLTMQIVQTRGGLNAFYGLVFHFREDNNGNVYCYAFVINSQGDYGVWKFDPNAPVKPEQLWTGHQLPAIHSGLNQANILQAIIQGNTFSFKVNGTFAPLNGGSQSLTDSSSPYTGGNLAVLVSGPNSSFTVKQVQLAVS